MSRSDRGSAALSIHAVAASVVVLAVAHVVVDADPLVTELAEAAILFVFAAATAAVGVRLQRSDATPADDRRILYYVLGGGLLVGALAVAFVAIRVWSGEVTTESWFVVSIGWSVGVASGAWTGYYSVRTRAALEEQRDLAKRLTVLQRVLRHNLRNEMTIVGGTSRDLRALLDDDERAARKLDVVDRHVEAVIHLSEQSQTLTRIWQSPGDSAVDMTGVLRAEAERFREAYPDVDLDADVPDGLVVRAHHRIRMAVEEALDNAVEHNESVEVDLDARVSAGAVTVEVSDTGSGVPPSELQPLWASGEAPLSHTTGLGLWLIYWLVETSDGELEVSADGRGTTVSMTFERA